jgi:hypothetical protein
VAVKKKCKHSRRIGKEIKIMKRRVIPCLVMVVAASLVLLSLGCATQRTPYWYTVTGSGALSADYAPGQARLMARKAAEEDARRQLLEAAKGVAIDSRTTVKDFMLQDDYIRSRVQGYIRGAQILDTRFNNDGTVEVDMRIDLNGIRDLVR